MKSQCILRAWKAALVLAVALALAALAGPVMYVSLAAPATATIPTNIYDWPQFNGNAQHSGNNTLETAISRANVATLRRIFLVPLPDVAGGAPAEISGANTPGGTRDLLFLTTRNGTLLALDAHTGSIVWSAAHPAGNCRINSGGLCYTTSSPAIDPNRQYVYTYTMDGYVHKHRISDGGEVIDAGWPRQATLKLSDLVNADNEGNGGAGNTGGEAGPAVALPHGGGPPAQPAAWTDPTDGSAWVFVANATGISGLRLSAPTGGAPALQALWQQPGGGTSPAVANNVLYYAGSRGIQALDPRTGRQLWQDASIGSIHWESPIVASGVLYIADDAGHLAAYAPMVLPERVYLPVTLQR